MMLSKEIAWIAIAAIFAAFIWIARRGRRLREAEKKEQERREARVMSARTLQSELIAAEAMRSAEAVVKIWGRFLESIKLNPGEIRDASELPYPKQRIEDACFVAIVVNKADPNFQDVVAASLLFLAQYQEGVGTALNSPSAIADKYDPQTITDAELRKLAAEISSAGENSENKKYQKLVAVMESDMHRLMQRIEIMKM